MVRAVLLAAAYAALAMLAAGLLLAAAFSDDSLIGLVGRDVGIVTEALRQVVQMLLADVISTGSFGQESWRSAPAILVLVPIGACAVAASSQASGSEGLSRPARLALGAATGIPFALLMVIVALAAGTSGDIEPSVGGAFGYGLLWGGLGGLLGTLRVVDRGVGASGMPARRGDGAASRGRVRAGLVVAGAALKPLGVLLLVSTVIGLSLVLVQTAAGAGAVLANRPLAIAFVENALYLLEHGLHFAELGALVEFRSPGSLGALGLPIPVGDVTAVTGGDSFRIFGYREVLRGYVFVPLLLVGIALPVLLALYAGFSTARLQSARSPLLGAAWGAVVGPAWAVAMGLADAVIGGQVFGAADGDSVFATFLLIGTAFGALGGRLAAGGGPDDRAAATAAPTPAGQPTSAPAATGGYPPSAPATAPAEPPPSAPATAPRTLTTPGEVGPGASISHGPPTPPHPQAPPSAPASQVGHPSSGAPPPPAPPRPGDPLPEPSTQAGAEPYAPIGGRARATRVLLVVLALLNVVGAVADGLTIELLVRAGNGNVTEAERAVEEIRQGVVGLTLLVVSIATIVLFLMWFFRAYRNLPRLGAAQLRYGHGWAIGAWFVPILNLFRPKQIADDIWRGSDPELPPAAGDSWRAGLVPAVFGWWWALWLISTVVDTQSARLLFRADTPGELLAATIVSLAGYLLSVPAALLAAKVVRRTTQRQEARAARLA